jgi:FAD/FMN-containing dehydrogenase
MSNVSIDAHTSTARVEAGVRFGQLGDAAAPFGLAPLPGPHQELASWGTPSVAGQLHNGAEIRVGGRPCQRD